MKSQYAFNTGMKVTRDADRDGFLVITGAKTIDRYKQLTDMQCSFTHPEMKYAFGAEERAKIIRELYAKCKEGEKVQLSRYGMIATPAAVKAWNELFISTTQAIHDECDPQEVYCYEYNNHESFINWDGDEEPLRIVRSIWGEDVEIRRF